jgi:hypothetical protein
MKRLELQVVEGELAGRRFQVDEGGLRLGRSSSNNIHVPDEELSRNHCLFEQSGESGIRLIDLASANGTKVNGELIGGTAVELKAGDMVSAGSLVLRVVAPGSANGVDLGLGASDDAPQGDVQKNQATRRSPLANVLWVVAAALLAAAIYLVLARQGDVDDITETAEKDSPEVRVGIVEMSYERVAANSESIFRYYMALSPDGMLKVVMDDVSGETRHIDKSKRLGTKSLERVREILLDQGLLRLDGQYVGPDGEPPELRSWILNVVYSDKIRSFSVVNTQTPEAFGTVIEKLESFVKNELGIWAIQSSRAELVKAAAESYATGRTKWDERDVQYGNIDAAIRFFREAIVYLDTVNPKPPEYDSYLKALEAAESELDVRYHRQRVNADRAINLGDWATAREELQILCEMVPNRDDDRNRDALSKLNDVENRLRGGGR